MTRIAIVGCRPPPRANMAEWRIWLAIEASVYAFVEALSLDVVVVSGGAHGVDDIAASVARARDIALVVHPADWKRHGKAAGMIRNGAIVADCEELHAWPAPWSRGTWDTIRKARAAGKPCTVHETWKEKRA